MDYNPQVSTEGYALINKWILSRLNATVQLVNKNIDDYEFGYATQNFQQFWQYNLCDVYLEAIKYVFTEKNTNEDLKK
jgi:valyl-tRNA synthetase